MRKFLYFISTALLLALSSCSDGGSDTTGTCSALGLSDKAPTENVAKIANGTACAEYDKSAVVALIRTNPDGSEGLCTGTLITPTQVITAAHCLSGAVAVDIVYGVSSDKYRLMTESTWTIDPNYQVLNTGRLLNDVGIVNLSSAINMASFPILVNVAPQAGQKVTISGFGVTSGSAKDIGTLRTGAMTISGVDSGTIQAIYAAETSNTCFGDSGGPLLLQSKGQHMLIGTTSYGNSQTCAVGEQSVFMNLQSPSIQTFLRSAAPGARYN